MFLDFFRKRVIASRTGLALFYALIFSVSMSVAFGFRLGTIIFYASTGFLVGLVVSSKFQKNDRYFVDNLTHDKYDVTRKYSKLFRTGGIPKTKAERIEYTEYLEAIEKVNSRSVPKEIVSLAFLLIVFLLMVLGEGRLTLMSTIFGAVIIIAGYGFVHSRANLKKIEKLKDTLKTLK